MDGQVYSRIETMVEVLLKQGVPHDAPEGSAVAHYHNTHEICLFRHSQVQAFMQNEWYDVRDGDIVIIPHYQMHRYVYSNQPHYTRLLISVSNAYLEHLYRSVNGLGMQQALTFDRCIHLRPGQEKFRRLWQNAADMLNAYQNWKRDGAHLHETVFRTRFFDFLYEMSELIHTQERPMCSSGLDWVSAAIRYIDQHHAQPITLDEVASEAHIDKYHLCHIFKQHTGMSVVGYIHHIRIIEAEKMLLYTELPFDVISSVVGFHSIQHFYRVFKNIAGVTPGEYRAQSR